MEDLELKLEKNKLQEITTAFHEVYEDTELALLSLKKRPISDPYLYSNLLSQYENRLNILQSGFHKPYFARIDFESDCQEKKEICYLGKVGIQDFEQRTITVDWRAPIASLYYDSNIGPVSYEAPEGTIQGYLTLKRQYEIEKGQLLLYRDVDTVSNDEILKPYLGVNADNRLKNIVSSIQMEQNQIIRESLHNNLICQGVAGSGKTTVALHRIAYLAYHFRDEIRSDQYMVIGPNTFFIHYISSVLPDLDVTRVAELTFEQFVRQFIGENLNIEELCYNSPLSDEINPYYFKVSLAYKDLLDNYVTYLDHDQVVPKRNFIVRGITILSEEMVLKTYQEVESQFYTSIESKIERTILLLSNYIKLHCNHFISKVHQEVSDLFEHNNLTKEQYQKDYTYLKKELENGCITSLRSHFKINTKKTSHIYQEFLDHLEDFTSRDIKNSLDKIRVSKSKFSVEDLPGILYLHYLLHGSREFKKYQHIVVDEAQDYGLFHFYVLRKVLSNATFSIFGDLAQSIYDYRSIDTWDEVKTLCFQNKCQMNYLLKSYRTTIEIMEDANQILDFLNMKQSIPVIRHGESVKYLLYSDISLLITEIKKLEEKAYQSIAIITRTDQEAKILFETLKETGMSLTYLGLDAEEYCGGICLLSSSCSKGLEFDAVILVSVSEATYSSENETDLKNLYVAMTRALHELIILFQLPITKPLVRNLISK